MRGGAIDLSGYRPGDAAEERRRSDAAVARALAELAALRRSAAGGPGPAGAVLEAHEALLADPELAGAVAADVAAGAAAPTAWGDRLAALGGELEAMDDPYLRARAEDVRSVRRRVLAALAGPGARTRRSRRTVARGPRARGSSTPRRRRRWTRSGSLGVAALAGGDTGHGV
ncbi:phosphoenolpyruvate-utilizing N-terminal domain-containing protein, partial [Kocuria sp. CNJ-770]|uniref:phosphoenolpyruvate-utilizing N-terminal domain-containing protein n=1 Tax=Kocuria sp. CNJ-770 TaxID=1904964 RepID=UPI0026F410E8